MPTPESSQPLSLVRAPENPYRPPSARVDDASRAFGGRVWREGKILHMTQGASLPPRCVRCNAPADTRLERRMYWHSPWLAFLILAGVLVYAIVAVIVRKRADVELGMCTRHMDARRNRILIAWACVVFGVGGCVASLGAAPGVGFLLGFVGVIAAIAFGMGQSNVLRPVRIDDQSVQLKGASEEYLASLERQAA
jgi:hypothetical protein